MIMVIIVLLSPARLEVLVLMLFVLLQGVLKQFVMLKFVRPSEMSTLISWTSGFPKALVLRDE